MPKAENDGRHRRPLVQAPQRRRHLPDHRGGAQLLGRHADAVHELGDQDLLGPQVGQHLRADAEAARDHGGGVLGLAVGAQHLGLAGHAEHVLLGRAVDAVVQVGEAARQRLGPQRIPAEVGDALGDLLQVVGRRGIRHLERIHGAYHTSIAAGTLTPRASDRWLVVESPAGDPLDQIERFLAGHGFGSADPPVGMVADLYLGYRLAASMPGVHEPRPPEPCPQLPLAACRVRSADPRPASAEPFQVGEFVPTWTPAEHAAAVEQVRAAIGRGDVYQVNLVQHLWAPFRGSPAALETALAPLDAPWAHALHGDGWSIVSATRSSSCRRAATGPARCRSRARARPAPASRSRRAPRTGPST